MKERKTKNVIVKCAADLFLPLALVFGFYVVLHGEVGPGGGFQGGVLVAAAVLLLYLGYGMKFLNKIFNKEKLHRTEALAEIVYVLLAVVGVVFGVMFCQNIEVNLFAYITESASLMNDAVGVNVLTGVGLLLILLLGMLTLEDEETEGGEEA